MLRSSIAALAALTIMAGAALAAPSRIPTYTQRPEVRAFVADMAKKHGFAKKELGFLFDRVRYQPEVIAAITPAAPSTRSWRTYRDQFINDKRIEAGARFFEQHAAALARAEREYGVPAEIVVAIIGVETQYGGNVGRFRVVDALTTLAFDYPPRAEFFRSELENFLLFARESGRDVFSVKGSYAGAIGIPQFMPGSYRRYAVDFDGDGKTDLAQSAADAIGSIANFLKSHGWQARQPIALPTRVEGEPPRKLLEAGMKPSVRCTELAAQGVKIADGLAAEAQCALIALDTPGESSEYLAGLHNFWVITRYNHDAFYAAAVRELAAAVKVEHERSH